MLEEGEIEESEEIVGYKSHDIELKRANLEEEGDDDYRQRQDRKERRRKKHKKRKRREEEDGRDTELAKEVQELVEEAPGD